jgi:hypothetical protein
MLPLLLSIALAVPISAAPLRAAGPPTAFGQSALALGDLTGDGRAEVVLGVADTMVGGQLVGEVRVWDGGAALSPYATGQGNANLLGLGASARIADLSCDGVPDLIVSASGGRAPDGAGAVFAWFGPLPPGQLDPAQADLILFGDGQFDGIGRALAVADDVDGDNCSDLIVGSPYVDVAGTLDAGAVYLVLGGLSGAHSVGAASAVTLLGSGFYGQLGYSVSSADVDGDGLSDLLSGDLTGASGYVWATLATTLAVGGTVLVDAVSTGITIAPPQASVGVSIYAADLDNDGAPELLFGAPTVFRGGVPAGGACLLSTAGLGFGIGGRLDASALGACAPAPAGHELFGTGAFLVRGLRGPGSRDALVLGMLPIGGGLRTVRPTLWNLSGPLPPPGGPWLPTGPGIDSVPGVLVLQAVGTGGDVDGDGRPDLAIAALETATGRVWVTVW